MTRDELFEMISTYVDGLETGESVIECKCQWIDVPNFVGRRKVGQVDPQCPVHTKEGLILDFVAKHLHPGEYDAEPVAAVQ